MLPTQDRMLESCYKSTLLTYWLGSFEFSNKKHRRAINSLKLKEAILRGYNVFQYSNSQLNLRSPHYLLSEKIDISSQRQHLNFLSLSQVFLCFILELICYSTKNQFLGGHTKLFTKT